EDVTQLSREVARSLKKHGLIEDEAKALELHDTWLQSTAAGLVAMLGGERRDFARQLLASVERRRNELWRERVRHINWELYDEGTREFCWYALQEVVKAAKNGGYLDGAEVDEFATAALMEQLGKPFHADAFVPFVTLREELGRDFKNRVFFWPR